MSCSELLLTDEQAFAAAGRAVHMSAVRRRLRKIEFLSTSQKFPYLPSCLLACYNFTSHVRSTTTKMKLHFLIKNFAWKKRQRKLAEKNGRFALKLFFTFSPLRKSLVEMFWET
jgi:hypothetical protein